MAAKPKDLVSAAQLAADWNCTRQNAHASIARWGIKRYAGALVSRAEAEAKRAKLASPRQAGNAARRWAKSEPEAGKPAPGAGSNGHSNGAGHHDAGKTRAEAERIMAWLRAERERLSLEREKGTLVDASEVEIQWATVCTMVRDSMLGLANKLSGRLSSMNDANEITVFLKEEIRAELTKVSKDLGGPA